MHAVAPLIDESSVEYPGNGVVRFNAAIRVAIKRYNHAVTWATRHFISLISISKETQTFEKLFFYTLSLPLPAVSAGMAHILICDGRT